MNQQASIRELRFLSALREFVWGRGYMALCFFAAAFGVVTGWEIPCAVVLGYIASAVLILSPHWMPAFLPILMISATVTRFYDCFDALIGYWWVLIVPACAIVFHIVRYRRPLSVGRSFWGLCAVAVAVTLGGLGSLSLQEYFRPIALFYVIGLGAGMVVFYLLLRSEWSSATEAQTGRDRHFFACTMYLWGLICAFMVFFNIAMQWDTVIEKNLLPEIQWSNNVSTMMMFALPFPFYFARDRIGHLAAAYGMYFAILCTGSRGGWVCGTAEFLVCVVYGVVVQKGRMRKIASVAVLAAFVTAIAVFHKPVFSTLGIDRYFRDGGKDLISDDEARARLLVRSWEDFRSAPIFGRGLAYSGNADIYAPKKGAMHFYHMMIPQIIGSMGCVGIAAYGYQFIDRLRIAFRRVNAYTFCLFLSYMGIFLMSQVNPGEFCPVPYQMVTVILFVLLECDTVSFRLYNKTGE